MKSYTQFHLLSLSVVDVFLPLINWITLLFLDYYVPSIFVLFRVGGGSDRRWELWLSRIFILPFNLSPRCTKQCRFHFSIFLVVIFLLIFISDVVHSMYEATQIHQMCHSLHSITNVFVCNDHSDWCILGFWITSFFLLTFEALQPSPNIVRINIALVRVKWTTTFRWLDFSWVQLVKRVCMWLQWQSLEFRFGK